MLTTSSKLRCINVLLPFIYVSLDKKDVLIENDREVVKSVVVMKKWVDKDESIYKIESSF